MTITLCIEAFKAFLHIRFQYMITTVHHRAQTGFRIILSWLLTALIVGITFEAVIRTIVFLIMKVYEFIVQGQGGI